MRHKTIGCDGAGLMGEFGPNSWWAHGFTLWDILDDDEAVASGKWFKTSEPKEVEHDQADWWKNDGEG